MSMRSYRFGRSRVGLSRLSLYLLVFVGAALALNGWIFSGPAIAWSRSLTNPDWAPPGAVIGAVWTGLFALMAVALWMAERAGTASQTRLPRLGILALYTVCMGWTWGYFGLQNIANGFYVTVAAFALGAPVLIVVFRVSRAAGLLLLPLQGWLGFALVLSWATWRLNV